MTSSLDSLEVVRVDRHGESAGASTCPGMAVEFACERVSLRIVD
ncbi:MAG TPA: hypothetical protein VIP05_09590 [Burkholderiaceae bacterium]